MNFDAFGCDVDDLNIENASGCHVAKAGPWEGDVTLVDGAIGIVSDRIAEHDLCHRYAENAGRARDFVMTPKSWGDDPCGVNGSDNTGGGALTPGDKDVNTKNGDGNTDDSGNLTDEGSGDNGGGLNDEGSGDNSGGDTGGQNGGDSTTVNGKTRVDAATYGSDTIPFQPGDAALGAAIEVGGVTVCTGTCYVANATQSGFVHGGVVNPNKDELEDQRQHPDYKEISV
jgi:hypothetical protein